jgi:methylenetetrahydrofolate--tRNA-(uracil-5-)-methyltransferase
MLAYVTSDERRDFQPMNTNYGLFPPLARKLRGREKKAALAERALRDLTAWQTANGLLSFSASALPLADSAPSQFAV